MPVAPVGGQSVSVTMYARFSLLLLCACAVAALALPQPQQRAQPAYTNRYDNIDVDKILSSRRLVSNYMQCITDRKPCSPDGAELKKVLPEAIRTKCAKCSEGQKQKAIKVIRKLQKDYPAEWKMVTSKWDPNGKLMREFEQDLARTNKAKQG